MRPSVEGETSAFRAMPRGLQRARSAGCWPPWLITDHGGGNRGLPPSSGLVAQADDALGIEALGPAVDTGDADGEALGDIALAEVLMT